MHLEAPLLFRQLQRQLFSLKGVHITPQQLKTLGEPFRHCLQPLLHPLEFGLRRTCGSFMRPRLFLRADLPLSQLVVKEFNVHDPVFRRKLGRGNKAPLTSVTHSRAAVLIVIQ